MTELLKWARNQWDRVAAAAAGLLGLLVILLGWNGISNSLYPAEQLPYMISGGILGLFMLGGAATLWLSADLRDEWRKLDELTRIAADLRRRADVPEVALSEATPLEMERSR